MTGIFPQITLHDAALYSTRDLIKYLQSKVIFFFWLGKLHAVLFAKKVQVRLYVMSNSCEMVSFLVDMWLLCLDCVAVKVHNEKLKEIE
jgi:hypothetical protein